MSTFRNTENTWGWPAKVLHWLGAIAILILLCHGWWMTHLAPRPDRLANYAWHAALGYDLLALLVLRLLWRWSSVVPALPKDTKRWERFAAETGHLLLYVLMFATTLAGWALALTMRRPLVADLAGISLPLIHFSQDRAVHRVLETGHRALAYGLAIIAIAHVIGALRHHYIKRNDVLWRMV